MVIFQHHPRLGPLERQRTDAVGTKNVRSSKQVSEDGENRKMFSARTLLSVEREHRPLSSSGHARLSPIGEWSTFGRKWAPHKPSATYFGVSDLCEKHLLKNKTCKQNIKVGSHFLPNRPHWSSCDDITILLRTLEWKEETWYLSLFKYRSFQLMRVNWLPGYNSSLVRQQLNGGSYVWPDHSGAARRRRREQVPRSQEKLPCNHIFLKNWLQFKLSSANHKIYLGLLDTQLWSPNSLTEISE